MAVPAQLTPTDQSQLQPSPPIEQVTVSATRPKAQQPPAPSNDTGTDFTAEGLKQKYQQTEQQLAAIDSATGKLQPPKLETPPLPETKQTSPLEAWGSSAMALAVIASALTRQPLTTALNAMGATLKAFKENDMQNAQMAFQQWKAATDMAVKQAQFQNEAYKTILQSADKDKARALAELNAYGSAFNHTAMVAAAKDRNLIQAKRLALDGAKFTEDLQKNAVKVQEGKEYIDRLIQLKKTPEYQKATPDQRAQMEVQIEPGGSSYTPEAIDLMATEYRLTNKMPAMGRANEKARALVVNRAAAQAHEMGMTNAEIVALQSGVSSDTTSLRNMTKVYDSSTGFENTALGNLQAAVATGKKAGLPNMGPWLNRFILEGRTAMGDPHTPAFVAQLMTGADEYAKVINGATGSQGSTVDSRRQAVEMISPYLNMDQLQNVVAAAKTDMDNKRTYYADQIKDIRFRIANPQASELRDLPRVTTQAEYDALDNSQGDVEYVGADGKKYRKPKEQ